MNNMTQLNPGVAARATPVVGSTKVYRRDGSQVLFVRGQGGVVFDDLGQDYLDFACGVGGVVLGHADTEFTAAMREAISFGLSFPGYGAVHDQLAEVMLAGTSGVSLVSYFKTSSEAVNAAVRLAVAETGRAGIVRCGYTGQGDWQMAHNPGWHEVVDSPFRYRVREVPGCRGIYGDELVADWVDLKESSLTAILEAHGDILGTMVLDAYQFELGDPVVLLQGIARCRQRGLIVVLDETKTAGRSGSRGSRERALDGLVQYTILGKAIGNGAALSVLLGPADREPLYKVIKVGGTHSKETFGAYAGLHTANLMQERGGYQRLAGIGQKIVDTFNAAAETALVADLVKAVPMLGGRLFDFDFAPHVLSDDKARKELVACMLERGLVALEGHCSFVSLAHDNVQDMLFERAKQAFVAWRM